MLQLVLLAVLAILMVAVVRQAHSILTSPTTRFPTGRLVVVLVLCLVAGFAIAFVVAFLLSLFLPHGLFQGFGRVFFGMVLVATLFLYGKAKAWVLEHSRYES